MNQFHETMHSLSFDLAYFIHTDPKIALEITQRAAAKLEVIAQQQFKRFYYRPRGRFKQDGPANPKPHRTKVILQERHLLQHLVYLESEYHELDQEQPSKNENLTQEDGVVRFVKFLVKATFRRNAFYATLGVSRLLHYYSTNDAADIYGLLVQDPERVGEYDYFRSRKKQLMDECCKRFGDALQLVWLHRGEQRFRALKVTEKLIRLVSEALRRFAPWEVHCKLPEPLDSPYPEIPDLAYEGDDPDGEHHIELKRMAAVYRPESFAGVVAALGLTKPQQMLTVPDLQWIEDSNGSPPRHDRFHPPKLSEHDLQAIHCFLTEQAQQRRNFVAGMLSIWADGVKQAEFDLGTTSRARFSFPAPIELLEVRGPDATLLATCLVDESVLEANQVQTAEVSLEADQNVCFLLRLTEPYLQVEVRWHERRLARAARLAAIQWITKAKSLLGLKSQAPLPIRWLASVSLVLVVLVSLLFLNKPGRIDLVSGTGFFPETLVEQPINRGSGNQGQLPDERNPRLFVGSLGETQPLQALSKALQVALPKHTGFKLAANQEDAQVMLKNLTGYAKAAHPDDPDPYIFILVNEAGGELWSVLIPRKVLTHTAPKALAEEIAIRLAEDL